jgi:hypothetical protein
MQTAYIPCSKFNIHILSLRSFIQRIRPGPRLFWKFLNKLIFYGKPHAQPPSWRTTPCRSSAAAYSVYSQQSSIAGGHVYIWNPMTSHAVVTRDPPNTHVLWVPVYICIYIYIYIYIYVCVCVCVCVCVYIYIYMYVCVCVCVYTVTVWFDLNEWKISLIMSPLLVHLWWWTISAVDTQLLCFNQWHFYFCVKDVRQRILKSVGLWFRWQSNMRQQIRIKRRW